MDGTTFQATFHAKISRERKLKFCSDLQHSTQPISYWRIFLEKRFVFIVNGLKLFKLDFP